MRPVRIVLTPARFRAFVWIAAALLHGAFAPAVIADPVDPNETAKAKADTSDGSGTLSLNPNPAKVSLGAFGEVSVSGALSGYGLIQSNAFVGDRTARVDVSNLQVIVQHTHGPVQVFVQAGLYSIPSLGQSNASAIETTMIRNFGPVPLAYATLDLGEGLSVSGGQLNSLFGGEATFTYQNLNIVRGLLFNQTTSVSRGAQMSYDKDGINLALSLTDGFYSGRLTWVMGAASYQVNKDGKISLTAGANVSPSSLQTPPAPLLLNNSSMYNLGYTYTAGRWTVTPFVQVTHVARDVSIGIPESASTYSGAFLANYAFTSNISLSGRAEYIAQFGARDVGTVAPLYGPGSRAYSLTLTPTWQKDRYFARCEYSFVKAIDAADGLAFGRDGSRTQQSVFAVETGILF